MSENECAQTFQSDKLLGRRGNKKYWNNTGKNKTIIGRLKKIKGPM